MYKRLAVMKGKQRASLLLAALVLIAAAAVGSSGAVFTAHSANPANVFTAGNLSHVNSKANAAILTASKMKPLDTATGSVTITNDGDIPGTFSLSTSNLTNTPGGNGGLLSAVLLVKVVDGTTTVYDGPINAVGTVPLGTFAPAAVHTYAFTVTFPDGGTPGSDTTGDNAYKSSSMAIEFDWTEVQ